ncbi:hypothetical protein DM02DRAFT_674751 [Periconia macrospinosa]|uniref:DUF6604 domain-containing protein n=1 Tax=Periconia macrospinosa TaxID=97972 RepID=A0A2V1DEL4_9PLEO|nr:hypothetical protein DM02DRAFT_674751 [Periconia macrospinosa]
MSYKRATKTALQWLSAQPCLTEATFRSTREIADSAKRLPDKYDVPAFVIKALREAIGLRRKVHHMYQELHASSSDVSAQDNDNAHGAFITRLEDTLRVLQLKKTETQSSNKCRPDISQGEPSNNQNHNRYALLGSRVTDHRDKMKIAETVLTAQLDEDCYAQTQTIISDNDRLFVDDDLGEWIELSLFRSSLDATLDQSNKYWTASANGSMPLCLSAWLSSFSFYEVGRRYEKIDYDTLLSKWTENRMKQVEIQFQDIPGLQSETRRFTDPPALSLHRSLLQLYRTLQENDKTESKAGKHEDFSKIITPFSQDRRESYVNDRLAIYQMLSHMQQLLVSKRSIAAIETPQAPQPICEPLLPLFDKLFRNKGLPVPVQMIFGMEMLLSSYKAYTWPGGVLKRQSCRISALTFAQEVQKSFSVAIHCIQRDEDSISAINLPYLQNVFDGLEGYTKEVCFDLYYQAPWTAGCHMVEILAVAMFEGLHLCCNTGYLCAVLHLYNALRSTDSAFRRIKLFDTLCTIFQDKLFLGVLCTENFSSHFRRAMGGKLTKKATLNPNARMKLSKPIPGLSKRKTSSTRFSYFLDLHIFGYEPSADFWYLNIETKSRWRQTTQRERDDGIRRAYSSPLALPLGKIKENIMQEFNGPLPVARINYLAVFVFAADCMEKLCMTFSAVKDKTFQPDKDLGFNIVDSLLDQIVAHLRDEMPRQLLPYWRPVNNAKNFFNSLDRELSLEQFLWKSAI